jgi:hypothetical protein
MLIFESLKAPNTASYQHAKPAAIDLPQIQAAVFQSEFSGCHCELRKSISAPDVLRIPEIQRWIEIRDLTCNLAVKRRGIELGNPTNTTLAIHQIFPKRLQIASEGGNYSNTGYNDSSVAHEDRDTALDCNLQLSNRNLKHQNWS